MEEEYIIPRRKTTPLGQRTHAKFRAGRKNEGGLWGLSPPLPLMNPKVSRFFYQGGSNVLLHPPPLGIYGLKSGVVGKN